MSEEEIPRRNQLDRNQPAELAILEALKLVEDMSPDTRLTMAVVLLDEARDYVADYIDDVPFPHETMDTYRQAAEDLTLANAGLKREAEQCRVELARLKFRNTELEKMNTELLGEHGAETAKQLVGMLQEYRIRNLALSVAMTNVSRAIPGEFWPESDL